MKRIVLNTTSSCLETLNVPHNIEFIRFSVIVNNVDFVDGVNITAERLSSIMTASPAAPTSTVASPPETILQKFIELENRGYTDVFVVTISSMISKTFENVNRAKALYTGKLNIFVYDSKTATIMEGALAFEADQLLKMGKSFDAIAQRLDQIRQNTFFQFSVSSLDYLIANKKISTPAGFFANLLDIRPIIELNDVGELVPRKKVRKIENAINAIAEYIYQLKQKNRDIYLYVVTGGDPLLDEYTLKLLAQQYGIANIPLITTSTITLANHGPHMVGIGAFLGERPLLTKYL